jgi:hypothetical protein
MSPSLFSFLKVGARVNVRLRVQLMDALLMQGKALSRELLACLWLSPSFAKWFDSLQKSDFSIQLGLETSLAGWVVIQLLLARP